MALHFHAPCMRSALYSNWRLRIFDRWLLSLHCLCFPCLRCSRRPSISASHWEFKDEIASFKQLHFLTLDSYTPRGFVISSAGSCKIKKGRRDSTAPPAAASPSPAPLGVQLLPSRFSQTRTELQVTRTSQSVLWLCKDQTRLCMYVWPWKTDIDCW